MKLFNNTDLDIINYRIETPKVVDEKGKVIIQGKTDTNTAQPGEDIPPVEGIYFQSSWDSTRPKRSKLFTIKAGETVELPEYAGDILLKTYTFLKKV